MLTREYGMLLCNSTYWIHHDYSQFIHVPRATRAKLGYVTIKTVVPSTKSVTLPCWLGLAARD